jgi:glyoxylase-like metal-dependent hydrolase (beta-lactamase superfamily II)/rhodanese-related sulfurtransferase
MFFRQVLHRDLGCASYVVADGGVGAVIDPKWEIEEYLAVAEQNGFEIRHVLETHNHADHVSGRGRLAETTGATLHVPNADEVAFESHAVGEGTTVELGDVRIVAIETPGHRPEHTAYLVEDTSRGEEPWMVLTGDSLFVGDLARPDLAVEARDGARELHRSLRRLLDLDDFVEVWPGHIGGSLCGGAGMSETPGSTIGFERRFNRLLRLESEEAFADELTRHLPPQPPNFTRIVALNRGPLLRHAVALEPLAPQRVEELLAAGATLLDGREPREYAAEHVPGSLSVTMVNAAVGTRAAWVVDPETEVVVTAASDADAERMARMLEAVGFRSIRGFLAGGVAAWAGSGRATGSTPSIDVPTLADRLRGGEVELLDVREQDEWQEGHVRGSVHVPYHDLAGDRPLLASDNSSLAAVLTERGPRPLAVACSAGNRSSLAISLLRRRGVSNLVHVAGGSVEDLRAQGIELVAGD